MTPARPEARWKIAATFALFTLSGAAGLVYQSIWSHYLGSFLGHAAYAQSLVLAIFMGGMALGAWWVSRRAEGWRNLLAAYALVELLIGIAGALFHREYLALTGFAYEVVFPALQAGLPSDLFKWSNAVALILPQSILLGTTFPLMSNALIRRSGSGSGSVLGGLYFTNSIGAALGALAATFVLLPAVGLPGTVRAGAVLNVLVALAAFLLARTPEPAPKSHHGGHAVSGPRPYRMLMAAAFITGASSFVYEIGWVRMLSLAFGSTVHAFELMLAAFIGGLALGGLWVRRRIDGFASAERAAGWVQLMMGLAALASLVLYDRSFAWVEWFLHALERSSAGYSVYNAVCAVVASAIMVPAAFFAGMTLPLFTLAALRRGGGEAAVGRIYAANTVGAIAGVFLAVHFLMPQLGLKLAMILAAAADLALGVWLLRPPAGSALQDRRGYLAGSALAAAAVAITLLAAKFDPLAMAAGVYRTGDARMDAQSNEVLFYRDGKTASISLVEQGKKRRVIATNGKPDASIAMIPGEPATPDERTMVMAAALPLATLEQPADVANIGFGSGLTTHTLLLDPRVKRVDTIEIEPMMIEGAKGFRPVVERAYSDPRSHVYIEDARTYFTAHRSRYDIIVSEPSNPWVSGVASLFSREFYRFVPRHLKPGGLLVQWIQLYEISDELIGTILNGLQESFQDYVVYLSNYGDLILIARADGAVGDLREERLDSPELRAMLARVSLGAKGDVSFHRIAGRAAMAPLVKVLSRRVNSDFYPILSLEAPRSRFTRESSAVILGLPTADLPYLEVLGGTDLPVSDPTEDGYYPRTIFRAMAHQIVASRGSTDAPRLTPDLRLKLAMLREEVANCRNTTGTVAQIDVLRQMAAETVPYLRPEQMRGLWISADWLNCSGQAESVRAFLALLESLASRDHSRAVVQAKALLDSHRDDLSRETADWTLRAALLSAYGSGDDAGLVATFERYNDHIQSNQLSRWMREWMLQMAIARDAKHGQQPAAVPH